MIWEQIIQIICPKRETLQKIMLPLSSAHHLKLSLEVHDERRVEGRLAPPRDAHHALRGKA